MKTRVADPISIGSLDPDSESGSRRAKINFKSRKKLKSSCCFAVLDGLLRAEGFFLTWTFSMEALG
jgi:hypothetical protein